MAFLCTEKDVRRCFTVADKDKSGTLCREEILQVLQTAAYPIPDDFDKIMMMVDRNKDGRIDYSEFAKIYSNNMR